MNTLCLLSALLVLDIDLRECSCEPPFVDSQAQASAVLNSYDLVFTGSVTSRKFITIEPEYFGQNVRKLLLTFDVGVRIKGVEVGSITALAPISAVCERFPISTEFLIYASLVNDVFRIEYCTGAKRIGAETNAELGLLIEAGVAENL